MKLFKAALVGAAVVIAGWWVVSAPPAFIKISAPMVLRPVSEAVVSATAPGDYLAETYERSAPTLPGYDELVLLEDRSVAYATTIDGWIWKIDLATGVATRFVDTPLMPAGARLAPNDDDLLYFCASHLYGATYPETDRVGLYRLDLRTKQIEPLVLRVPNVSGIGGDPVVLRSADAPRLKTAAMDSLNSRGLAFCNDLDVSADGRRIYFTEPFAYEIAKMGGGGTYREAISLGQNGLVWRYDLAEDEVSLVAQNFTFPDGILVEPGADGRDQSLLVAETVKFRIQRMYLSPERAGTYELVQEDLPAMPDGMDRDAAGRIWIGMIKQRSAAVDWIHQNPWIKHLLLRLPHTMMPVSPATSFMVLSEDGSEPLFYSEHDGSVLTEISVVIPGRDAVYLATVGHDSKGLYRVPYPPDLSIE